MNAASRALVTLGASLLSGCGWFSLGVGESEVQAALDRKMPLTLHHIAITAPRVTLQGEDTGKVQVCARWELVSDTLPARLRPAGDVCAQTGLRWDKPACALRLDQPSMTRAGIAGAISLPGPLLASLTRAVHKGLHDFPAYEAGWLPCRLVSSVRIVPGKIEIGI